MTAIYLVFTILSLFTCMLPAGVFSVIWEPISDNLTVGVPYIAILRVLITAGVIGGVGILVGVLLGRAGKIFHVEVDPKEAAVRECLDIIMAPLEHGLNILLGREKECGHSEKH